MTYLMLLLSLVLALPAAAQWTEGAPVGVSLTDFDQTFTHDYSAAGESGTLDVTACERPLVSNSGGSDVSFYACEAAGLSRSQCRLVSSYPAGQASTPEPLGFPGGYALVWASRFVASGTATLTCEKVRNQVQQNGSWVFSESGGGSGGGVPGLVGTTGNDETIEHLKQLRTLAALPSGFYERHFYYSSFNGDDSNPGTKARPFRTMAKLMNETSGGYQPFTRNTFLDDGSVWSPNVISDPNEAFAGRFKEGDVVSWGSTCTACPCANTGRVVGTDGSKMVVTRVNASGDPDDSLAVPATGDELCPEVKAGDTGLTPATNGLTDIVVENTGLTVGSVFARLDNCPDRSPCILVESENPDNPAIFDADLQPFGGSAGESVFYAFEEPGENDGGILAVQNFVCQNSPGDCYGTVDAVNANGRFLGLNVVGRSFNDQTSGVGFSNNGATTHDGGWLSIIGERSQMLSDTSNPSASGAALAPTGSGGALMIGGLISSRGRVTTAGVPNIANTGGDLVLVGVRAIPGGPVRNTDALQMANFAADSNRGHRIIVADSVLEGAANGAKAGVVFSGGNGFAHQIELYNTRLYGQRGIVTSGIDAASGTEALRIIGRNVVVDENTQFGVYDVSGDCGAGDLLLDLEGVYDPEDIGDLCQSDATNANTLTTCQDTIFAACGGENFFAENSVDSGGATDGVYWSRNAYGILTTNLGNPGYNPSNGTINCAGCDFTAQFSPGMRIRTYKTAAPFENIRTYGVSGVTTTTLTLAPGQFPVTSENGTSGVEFREYTNPQLARNREHNSTGVVDRVAYSFTIPHEDGYIPEWVAGGEIRAFDTSR